MKKTILTALSLLSISVFAQETVHFSPDAGLIKDGASLTLNSALAAKLESNDGNQGLVTISPKNIFVQIYTQDNGKIDMKKQFNFGKRTVETNGCNERVFHAVNLEQNVEVVIEDLSQSRCQHHNGETVVELRNLTDAKVQDTLSGGALEKSPFQSATISYDQYR